LVPENQVGVEVNLLDTTGLSLDACVYERSEGEAVFNFCDAGF
jgi:hypothetical protein